MSIPGFTLDLAAWDAGFEAGWYGRSLDTCPYPTASQQAWSWHSGYIEGNAARQKP